MLHAFAKLYLKHFGYFLILFCLSVLTCNFRLTSSSSETCFQLKLKFLKYLYLSVYFSLFLPSDGKISDLFSHMIKLESARSYKKTFVFSSS